MPCHPSCAIQADISCSTTPKVLLTFLPTDTVAFGVSDKPPPPPPFIRLIPDTVPVGRSDIAYGALWGADPQPDRSHVLLAACLQSDTRFKPLGEQLSKHLVSPARPSLLHQQLVQQLLRIMPAAAGPCSWLQLRVMYNSHVCAVLVCLAGLSRVVVGAQLSHEEMPQVDHSNCCEAWLVPSSCPTCFSSIEP